MSVISGFAPVSGQSALQCSAADALAVLWARRQGNLKVDAKILRVFGFDSV